MGLVKIMIWIINFEFNQISNNIRFKIWDNNLKSHPIRIINLILIFLIFCNFLVDSIVIEHASASGTRSSSGPELMGVTVTPRSGTVEDEFLFMIIYKDNENRAPEYIKLVIDDNKYELKPLSSDDNIFSDGKNYFNKLKLSKGVHIYYFEASNGVNVTISSASTILVNGEPEEYTHLDVTYSVIFATMVIVIILIYGNYQLKKISQSLDRLSRKSDKDSKIHNERKDK
jgi:hypothetical protein